MILLKVNKVVPKRTVKGMAHHNKPKPNRLMGGDGCKKGGKHCLDCTVLPDCVWRG